MQQQNHPSIYSTSMQSNSTFNNFPNTNSFTTNNNPISFISIPNKRQLFENGEHYSQGPNKYQKTTQNETTPSKKSPYFSKSIPPMSNFKTSSPLQNSTNTQSQSKQLETRTITSALIGGSTPSTVTFPLYHTSRTDKSSSEISSQNQTFQNNINNNTKFISTIKLKEPTPSPPLNDIELNPKLIEQKSYSYTEYEKIHQKDISTRLDNLKDFMTTNVNNNFSTPPISGTLQSPTKSQPQFQNSQQFQSPKSTPQQLTSPVKLTPNNNNNNNSNNNTPSSNHQNFHSPSSAPTPNGNAGGIMNRNVVFLNTNANRSLDFNNQFEQQQQPQSQMSQQQMPQQQTTPTKVNHNHVNINNVNNRFSNASTIPNLNNIVKANKPLDFNQFTHKPNIQHQSTTTTTSTTENNHHSILRTAPKSIQIESTANKTVDFNQFLPTSSLPVTKSHSVIKQRRDQLVDSANSQYYSDSQDYWLNGPRYSQQPETSPENSQIEQHTSLNANLNAIANSQQTQRSSSANQTRQVKIGPYTISTEIINVRNPQNFDAFLRLWEAQKEYSFSLILSELEHPVMKERNREK